MNHKMFFNLLEQKAISRQTSWQIENHTINFNGKIWTFGNHKTGEVFHSQEPWTLEKVRELLNL